MIQVGFTRVFTKKFNALEVDLRSEVVEKMALFADIANHQQLKVHKLHGKFSNYFSFSVNYKIRVVFKYTNKKQVICVDVGDHEVYK